MAAFGSPRSASASASASASRSAGTGRGRVFACTWRIGRSDVTAAASRPRDSSTRARQACSTASSWSLSCPPCEPLREDRERLPVLRLGAVEIARRLEHQAVVAQHRAALEVVRAERPRHGVRERGEDGPGLLQFPAGRQDVRPVARGQRGSRGIRARTSAPTARSSRGPGTPPRQGRRRSDCSSGR